MTDTPTCAMAAGTLVGCGGTTPLTVNVQSITGEGHDLNVTRLTRLRDVQEIVCRLFRMPFPRTKACITVGGITYDEFADMPFLSCNGKDVMTVVFIHTDDPYFYDLRDRRPRPCTPPCELENELAVSPLELPPPIMLD